jgi:hypothetical protein
MYVVAIPSYQRAELLNRKTLKTLAENNIPRNRIYVFVANKTEEQIYKEKLNNDLYGHLIVGVKGLKNQRNFISRYFPDGKEILNMDDDIGGFKILRHKTPDINVKQTQMYRKDYYLEQMDKSNLNLDNFVKNCFKKLKTLGLFLWGIYPIANPYFMTPVETTDLRLIVGPVWGSINRHDKDLVLTVDEKEDVERTLQYYTKDRGVLRINYVCVMTTYYKTPGGMQAEQRDRKKDAYESALYLNKKYPSFTTLYLGKKSGYAEVKLKDKDKDKDLHK